MVYRTWAKQNLWRKTLGKNIERTCPVFAVAQLCCLVLKDEMNKNLANLKNPTALIETKVRPFELLLWKNRLVKAQ